jgi:dTDP-4-dehydrorhamnose 3,5-epimerase-like enzyme
MLRLRANFEHRDGRGKFVEVWRGEEWREMNFFTVKKGFTRGGHYHKETRELFFIVEGDCEMRLVDVRTWRESTHGLREEDIFIVDPYELHYLTALTDCKIVSLLSHPHDESSPDLFSPAQDGNGVDLR